MHFDHGTNDLKDFKYSVKELAKRWGFDRINGFQHFGLVYMINITLVLTLILNAHWP